MTWVMALCSVWIIDTVDTVPSVSGIEPDIAIDSKGYPHVVYYYQGYSRWVKYARWDGQSWIVEAVKEVSYVTDMKLALDKGGNPHIAYITLQGSDLKYVYKNYPDSPWVYINDKGGSHDRNIGIAVDDSGYVWVSFSRRLTPGMRASMCSYYDGSSWHDEVVDSSSRYPVCYGSAEIRLSSDGRVHLAYFRTDTVWMPWSATMYAVRGPSSWSVETVQYGGNRLVSLSLDPNRVPYVGYLGGSATTSRVAYRASSGTWNYDYSFVANLGYPRVVVGSDRMPRATFYYGSNAVLYTEYGAAGWEGEVVSLSGVYPDIALDGQSRPFIVYSDLGGYLMVAHKYPTSVEESVSGTASSRVFAYQQGGAILFELEGFTSPATVSLYYPDGRLLSRVAEVTGGGSFQVQRSGTYFVVVKSQGAQATATTVFIR